MPATLDLVDDENCIYQGDVYELLLTLTDDAAPTPQPLDLSTGVWRGQLRPQPKSDVVLAAFTFDTTDAADGILVAVIDEDGTTSAGEQLIELADSERRYRAPLTEVVVYFDIEDTDSHTTYFAGRIKVKLEVTR